MQLGDLSVAYERHVDAADRRRLFRNAHAEVVGHAAGAVVVSWQSGVYCEATAT